MNPSYSLSCLCSPGPSLLSLQPVSVKLSRWNCFLSFHFHSKELHFLFSSWESWKEPIPLNLSLILHFVSHTTTNYVTNQLYLHCLGLKVYTNVMFIFQSEGINGCAKGWVITKLEKFIQKITQSQGSQCELTSCNILASWWLLWWMRLTDS